MNMKVMTAREAKNSFGLLIDTSQREPVIVTRRERPVGVFLSIQEVSAIPALRKSLLAHIEENHEVSNPLLAMIGANENNRCFATPEVADQFISELRDEWKN